MTTVTTRRLAVPEQQVLRQVAAGSPLSEAAMNLRIREGTAREYLRRANVKLGVRETAAAVAVACTVGAIEQPQPLDATGLLLASEQRELVPLIAQGLHVDQMATKLHRPAAIVRQDGRALMKHLQARNPVHTVTRAWQYQLLTARQVRTWLP
jgi:DNA-binding NarL/FixJ family response regulator